MEEKFVTYEMPVPSKGSAQRFFTERFVYRVQNVLVHRPIEVDGVADQVLRMAISLKVFHEDLVADQGGLESFFEMAPGLNETTRELLSGSYRSNGKNLRIQAGDLTENDFRHRMPLWLVDPARKSGHVKFTQHLTMLELMRALTGGDRLDRITRHGWPDTHGERVGRKLSGDLETGAVTYTGYVLVTVPREPVTNLDKGTASFSRPQDIGQAIYLPMSLVGFIMNLYFKLEPKWREMISQEHELVEATGRHRRLLLPAGREEAVEPAAKPKRKPRPKRENVTAQVPDADPEPNAEA